MPLRIKLADYASAFLLVDGEAQRGGLAGNAVSERLQCHDRCGRMRVESIAALVVLVVMTRSSARKHHGAAGKRAAATVRATFSKRSATRTHGQQRTTTNDELPKVHSEVVAHEAVDDGIDEAVGH